MEKLDWKETINANIVMLKIVGLWPAGDESYGPNLYTLYALISIFLFQICHVFFQTVNLYLISDDLKAITGTIYIVLMDMAVFLKTYYLMKNMKMLKQLMITVNCDLFQPKNVAQKRLIEPNLKAWKSIVSTFWFLAVGCSIFWGIFPIMEGNRRLPFLAWYPIDTTQSPQYEFVYLHQTLAINFTSMANVNINTLIAALNMYVGAQFDLLGDDLRHLHEIGASCDVTENFKNRIRHHREILKFADYAKQFYSSLLLVEFFVDGVSIGLSMFQLTVVPMLSGEFYLYLLYANAVSVQIFMYCWFGNEINVKSSKLPYAVFESNWSNFSQKEKKNMIIFVLRVKKSLQISAFGLFYLSLETFVKIMRTAWSYFALLHQVSMRDQRN